MSHFCENKLKVVRFPSSELLTSPYSTMKVALQNNTLHIPFVSALLDLANARSAWLLSSDCERLTCSYWYIAGKAHSIE